MARHNKKRNTGLIYEFLVRTISDAIIESDDKKRRTALSILRSHFSRGSELLREFRLFHSLAATTVNSESVADSILEAAKHASKQYNENKLNQEKSLLIRSINHDINETNFYNRKLPEGEYRIYATIQTLINEWRSNEITDIVKIAKYEEQLKQWLLSPKKVTRIDEDSLKDADPLVEKLMLKKINERYNGNLTKEQSDLIRSYLFSKAAGDDSQLQEQMEQIKDDAIKHIDSYLNTQKGKNKYLETKLTKAKELILAEGLDELDDKKVERFLDVSKLKYEIMHKE